MTVETQNGSGPDGTAPVPYPVECELTEQPAMRYDFRELHAQLIERHLGLDPGPVFPEPFQTTGELDLVV